MKTTRIVNWIDTQKMPMLRLVRKWTLINSHTPNSSGLTKLSRIIVKDFSSLKGRVTKFNLSPFVPALSICKRPSAKKQILLVCHMDTVYSPKTQNGRIIQNGKFLKGPGVADAKGGIVVMLKALEAFEKSPCAKQVGWQVVLNTDEEIGSPRSRRLWPKLAKKFDLAFVFEPCLPNGNLVGARKGSGNFTLVAKGRSAHAGRDPEAGRNAIHAVAEYIVTAENLMKRQKGCSLNFGKIQGGEGLNVVPDSANVGFNIRIGPNMKPQRLNKKFKQMTRAISQKRKVKLTLHGDFHAPPKPLNSKALKLFKYVQNCGNELGLKLGWESSGGVCDGNRLAAAGLPVVDTMGVQGGHLHSPNEFLYVDSLTKRAQLTTLCLLKWASGEWKGIDS